MSYRTITRAVAGILVCVVPAIAFAASQPVAGSTSMTAAQMRAMHPANVTKAESAGAVTKAAGLSAGLSNAKEKSESAMSAKLLSH